MQGRYRKVGEIAGQIAIAAVILTGIVLSAALLAAFAFTALMVSS